MSEYVFCNGLPMTPDKPTVEHVGGKQMISENELKEIEDNMFMDGLSQSDCEKLLVEIRRLQKEVECLQHVRTDFMRLQKENGELKKLVGAQIQIHSYGDTKSMLEDVVGAFSNIIPVIK